MKMKYWALFLASVVVAVAANEDVYVSKREWDDSGLQVIGSLMEISSFATGLPLTEVYEVVTKIVGHDEASPWDLVETKVKREIRSALSTRHAAVLEGKLDFYKKKLREYRNAGKRMKDENRAKFIDKMSDYDDDVVKDAFYFNFKIFSESLKFDFGIFTSYMAYIMNAQLIRMMLIEECNKLQKSPEQYHSTYYTHQATHWIKKLEDDHKTWRRFAKVGGPAAAKKLFWASHSLTCEQMYDTKLSCHDFSGRYMGYWMTASKGNYYQYKFDLDDILPNGEVLNCKGDSTGCSQLKWEESGQCIKMKKNSNLIAISKGDTALRRKPCGTSPRRFYLKIAKTIWHEFTIPVLKLIGDRGKSKDYSSKKTTVSGDRCAGGKACSNPDDYVLGPWCKTKSKAREECYDTALPTEVFIKSKGKKDCLSPCEKFGESYKWCVTRYDEHTVYGGYWDYC